MSDADPPRRRYDKGERRRKHVGQGSSPELRAVGGSPRHMRGLCPATIGEGERLRLLNRAVPLPDPERELPGPKRLYAVHDGAIYEAQTSDHGWSYHAYPYKGKLSASILAALGLMALEENCLNSFERWVRDHIVSHGR